MNQFENHFNDGAYKWDAFNSHASVPANPQYTPPRFQPWEFKRGVSGSLDITHEGKQYFVQVFIRADRQNSTTIPSADNISTHSFSVNKFGISPVYDLDITECVLSEIEKRIFNNVEMLDNLTE
jgi:hypothetical protein